VHSVLCREQHQPRRSPLGDDELFDLGTDTNGTIHAGGGIGTINGSAFNDIITGFAATNGNE